MFLRTISSLNNVIFTTQVDLRDSLDFNLVSKRKQIDIFLLLIFVVMSRQGPKIASEPFIMMVAEACPEDY